MTCDHKAVVSTNHTPPWALAFLVSEGQSMETSPEDAATPPGDGPGTGPVTATRGQFYSSCA